MSQEIVKFDENEAISSENVIYIKEEFQDEYYLDNKVTVSETIITHPVNLSSSELNGQIRNDMINEYETLCVDHVNTHLLSSEVNDTVSNNLKIEDGIHPVDIQIKFSNELLFCNHCQEVYQDYCTKCRVLVHILNKRPHNAYNRIKELPKCLLETRESLGHLGIFCLKVIPVDVRFGPFTGLTTAGVSLRIKGGRFVVNDDKSELLNWMQYINPARNSSDQNLLPFQYEDKLYYCSTRRIQEDEELLVYFGEEYEDSLFRDVEMDFVPITKLDVENVFACTFCCLGFRSKKYLAEHKFACHGETNEMFSVEELIQCPFCKIHLEAKEYFQHHKDYCCETNATYLVKRDSPLPSTDVHELEIERRSFLRSKVKRWKYGTFKCTQCKFSTMYNADFRHHTNEHYEVKMHRCGICHRRYKAKESLNAHIKEMHPNSEGTNSQTYSTCAYFEADIKNIKERPAHSHDSKKQFPYWDVQTRHKCHLRTGIKVKQPNRGKYKCENCEFKTYYRTCLEMHAKTKHLVEGHYKCAECKFKTKHKSSLPRHIKAKHRKTNDYKCMKCEFMTNKKVYLSRHIKSIHPKVSNYKCAECEYKTNKKSSLTAHVKTKHLEEHDYKCAQCEYKTNNKGSLKSHIKTVHLKEHDFKCVDCEYKTNRKQSLKDHIKTIHLKVTDYKCAECEYNTNYKLNLEKHIKTRHLKISDYKCGQCEYKTNDKPHLHRHIKTIHLKEHHFKCAECEFKTNHKANLKRHVKIIHPKVADYKCAECEYKTNIESHLEKHIKRIHLKINDYNCAECEYKTNKESALERHIKTVHIKEHYFKCVECEFKTNHKSNLKRHLKIIHPKVADYKCAEYEYKTNIESHLEKHIKRIHLKINDYNCAECEYKTNKESALERHIKTVHIKEHEFKCAV